MQLIANVWIQKNKDSGENHVVLEVGGKFVTLEECNIDDIKTSEKTQATEVLVEEVSTWCGHCSVMLGIGLE
jgi:hypothetical protein